MAVNKVVYGNDTIMDITDTTVNPENVVVGNIFYNRSGKRQIGQLDDATIENHGLMSAADKAKLDEFESANNYLTEHQDISGKANSVDLATVATSGEYNDLLNKPTNVSSFTNDAGYLTEHQDISNKADKNEIPTLISELINDSGYITGYTETDPTVPNWAKEPTKPTYTAQEVGALSSNTFIPTNVSDLVNDAGYLTEHQDISGKVDKITGKGLSTNDFTDAYKTKLDNALIEHQDISGKANSADLATVATSGSYNDLSNKPFIPSAVSDLTDDSGHYTKPVAGIPASDLEETYVKFTDYAKTNQNIAGVVKVDTALGLSVDSVGNLRIYPASGAEVKAGTNDNLPITSKKTQLVAFYGLAKAAGHDEKDEPNNNFGTYSAEAKAAIQTMLDVPSNATVTSAISTAIGNIHQFDIQIVQSLPIQDIQEHTVYFVPKTGETNDVYDEYIYINNAWEMIGNTQIDLSNYATKNEIPNVPVQDVQVNGTSILSQGIANVPIAGTSFGVIKSVSTFGVGVNNNGVIGINTAADTEIKDGTNVYKPITSSNVDKAAFYGLAKVAGDTTQSQSDNAVGTYTDEAKTAIQTMLDVPAKDDIPEVPVQDVRINGESIVDENGIAKIPKAGNLNAGVIMVNGAISETGLDYALSPTNLPYMKIFAAVSPLIKSGTNANMPIVPSNQHESTFYGLAKAAGDTTQASSSNAVGTYTTEAKTAIQQMLDVPSNTELNNIPIEAGIGQASAKLKDFTNPGGTYIYSNTASGLASFAFGYNNNATGNASTAFGFMNTASGSGSIAYGNNNIASSAYTVAEGQTTVASGAVSHAAGVATVASGLASYVIGWGNVEDNYNNWEEWISNKTYKIGDKIKITTVVNENTNINAYICKIANSDSSFISSHWTSQSGKMNYILIAGNGSAQNRSNAYALDWDGNGHYMGNIYVGANADSTGGTMVATINDIPIFATNEETQAIITEWEASV